MTSNSKIGETPTAHLTEEQMRGYQSRSLPVEDRAAAGAHLAGCGACRHALLARMGTIAIPAEAAALREPLHLEYGELTEFLDGKLTPAERERAEDHLFLCASCARELDEMRSLDARLAAPAKQQVPAEPKISFAARLARFFAVPGRTREFGLAFGTFAVGAFLLTSEGATHSAVSGVSGAARLIEFSSQSHPSMHIGGFVLMAVGAGLAVYSFFRTK
ncbi:MAG TPA: zf-HC2 domain-containing protein [Terracidiphilus sp.]|nr:zf-HC2 domain-containing protein [Terracidiphilus sp.]